MKIRHLSRLLGGIAIFAWAMVWSGCSSSRQVSLATEQAALSGAEERPQTPADTVKKSTDEDEVMRLLGLNKNQPAEAAQPQPTSAGLENDRQRLEENLKEKDIEIANLKAELAERDRQLNAAENAEPPMEIKPVKTPVTASGTFQQRYDRARALYESRRYKEAVQEFEALISTDSANKLSDNCQYWIGECYYGMRAYNQAIVEFEKVFTFHDSDKNDDAQLKLGLCYTRTGNVEKAKSEFQKLLDTYPESEFRARAQYYLQTL
ncbi:MAG TPA: tetratricopeptide repeat protein [bacterium]|nr:tetratricopeptide repeat protein [bacterium]HPR88652.1 tetratricopeptide repeat protein [bacterium]